MPNICPGCGIPLKSKDNDTKNIWWEYDWWHRICQLKDSGEISLIRQLFEKQDDFDCDPTTAMADAIGQIGHFCNHFNKGKRKEHKIDFARAVERGVRYWEEET